MICAFLTFSFGQKTFSGNIEISVVVPTWQPTACTVVCALFNNENRLMFEGAKLKKSIRKHTILINL